jgi:myo-inositol 2-dehydrogenase / D-chiro-inositol 1-dehydrogenase
MSRIRLGVLGLGAVAQAVHLPLIVKRPDLFELASICDLAPEVLNAMGERYGVPSSRRFTEYEALLDAGGIDAVMVLARGSHAQAVLQAWRAGLPVFCEKPLAYTAAEVEELIANEPDFGHPAILVGYMKQYDPAVQEAVRLLAEVDDVREIEATVLHPPGAAQLAIAHVVTPSTPLDEAAQAAIDAEDRRLQLAAIGDVDVDLWRAYRGALVSSLAHDLSIMRSFGAPPETVEHADLWRLSSAHQVRDAGRDARSFGGVPPSISATGALAGGGRYRLAWHYLPDFPAYRETVRVVHGAGSIELVFPSPYLMHAPTQLIVSRLDGEAELRSVRRSVTEAFETQLEAFAAMLRTGTPPQTSLEGGLRDILDCQRIVATYAGRTGVAVGGEIGALLGAAA